MITFVGGSKFAKGGPNPLANMDSWGSISASRFGPGGPYPLADLDRGVQIQGGPNPLGHRQGNVQSLKRTCTCQTDNDFLINLLFWHVLVAVAVESPSCFS